MTLPWVPRVFCCVAALHGCVGHAAEVRRADFHVATNGRDDWSGRLSAPNAAGTDGPFATITRARDAVRAARGQGNRDRAYTVVIHDGRYALTKPIVFTPRDSGAQGRPVRYVAQAGEKPVFSGGRVISGWKQDPGGVWIARVSDVASGKWYFHQLFVNGERRTRARTPNEGYLRTDGPLPEIKNPRGARDNPKSKLGFRYPAGDLKRWDDLADVNLFIYHSWTASMNWIKALEEKDRIVRFTAPTNWPLGYFEQRQRYHIENCLEALDAPGEWYLQRKTGKLFYRPRSGEDMKQSIVVAPRFRKLVRFDGEPDRGRFVEHIHLEGLAFHHADWFVKGKGRADGQAAALTEAAVHARGARHCVVVDCEIAHVGEYGLWWGAGCQDNRTERCEIRDLGAGAVRIGEMHNPRSDNQAAVRNTVDNCFLHDGGNVFPAGVGVWIGRSSYNTVTHNEICDFYYTGISVGWSWGYDESSANHNVIEFNRVHHLGKGVLSDMGGIYTLGVSPGTRIRNNVFHDIHSYSYGGWGLYTDEGSSEILLENNVVYNTKTGGFHQHYGKNNVVRNNIFALSQQAQIMRSREERHTSFTFERNIVLCDNGEILGSNWGNGNYRMDHNLYWDTSTRNPEFDGMSFAEWRAKGRDVHSIIADPKFVDAKGYDFRLQSNSPASRIGFAPIDVSKVGLYGDAAWVEAPKKIVRAPLRIAEPPPGLAAMDDDFEDTPVGEPARGAVTAGEEKRASIRVTDETAAGGKRSLKFVDAPGLSQVWQPHLYFQPRVDEGTVTFSFSLRVESGAIVVHEWRDDRTPYRSGPLLYITAEGYLAAGGKPVIQLPHGKWVGLEIACALGEKAKGKYDLKVTLPGKRPRMFKNLACHKEGFDKLRWLGWISLAPGKAVFYVDDLKLSTTE